MPGARGRKASASLEVDGVVQPICVRVAATDSPTKLETFRFRRSFCVAFLCVNPCVLWLNHKTRSLRKGDPPVEGAAIADVPCEAIACAWGRIARPGQRAV